MGLRLPVPAIGFCPNFEFTKGIDLGIGPSAVDLESRLIRFFGHEAGNALYGALSRGDMDRVEALARLRVLLENRGFSLDTLLSN